MQPRAFLRELFDAAVAAADPSSCLRPHLPAPPRGRTVVVGAGKAAASMAQALEADWQGELSGVVVTRYGQALACRNVDVLEAAHPVPDAASEAAASRILRAVSGLNENDLVIALISGGGSALLSAPGEGLSLADKQAVNAALLASGAAIDEMNCVRKHLSRIKGGRLAVAAWPARLVALAISDVPGDDPAVIASGPTVADNTTCAEALAILTRYRIAVPDVVRQHLASGRGETPKPDDPRLARSEMRLIASPKLSLQAAANLARECGVMPVILGDEIEGEAREVARAFAGMAKSAAAWGSPAAAPCVLLSGGETTVTVKNPQGRGGRNSEFLLALAIALQGRATIHALAADTDGIDGSENNAGAYVSPDTLQRARALGLDPHAHLAANNAWAFFSALDDLLVTGPTQTNVNDFRAILIHSNSH